ALIHAATMVTAGVYMIVRLSPLYNAAPAVQFIILALGSLTALLAASIALVQYDIKKVLAYSTVSQLGYMFMALGAGAYSYAMFHLVTHAFFKGLLFMAAGAVITGCRHEQDMRRFGGLWSPMWGTFIAYLAGTYAIAGLPLGSGAYSKEAILWAVYTAPDTAAGLTLFNLVSWGGLFWGIGLAVAFLTACYMTRSLVLTFFGSYRGEGEASESSATMLVAMAVLIPPAMFFGHSRGIPLLESLRPWARQDLLLSQSELMRDDLYRALEHIALFAAGAGVVLMLLAYSIGRGFMMRLGNCIPERINPLCCKWWVDELYEYLIVRPLAFTARVLFFAVDRKLIDRSIDLSAEIAGASGQMLGLLHTGRIGHYLLIMLAGLFFGAAFWLVF
ncbi:MAG TPA: proton-conducting transporter membrane subunit, partial [Oligoflexia bacterium]|nr:proton-conducting transporter membrane subunit [Oligoflexia bacterium]